MSHYYFIRGYELNHQKPWAIPESFVEKAFGYYERRGSPFLENRRKVKHRVFLDSHGILHLGKPWEDFPEVPTWRQFLIQYEGNSREDIKFRLNKISAIDKDQLDDTLDCEYFYDQLAHNYLPAAKFAHLVDQLKVVTSDEKTGEVLGQLRRHEGSITGSDVLCMELIEPITLSWLQWAFEQVGEPANFYQF